MLMYKYSFKFTTAMGDFFTKSFIEDTKEGACEIANSFASLYKLSWEFIGFSLNEERG